MLMTFSPDSTHLATTRFNGIVEMWNIDSETRLWAKDVSRSAECKAPKMSALAFSEDSMSITLISPCLGVFQRTKLSVISGQCLDSSMGARIRADRPPPIALGASPERVALASLRHKPKDYKKSSIELDIWRVHDGVHIQTTTLAEDGRHGAFSRDLRLFAASCHGKPLRVWRVDNGECLCELSEGWCNTIVFSSDSRYLMTASDSGDIHIWALSTGVLSHTFSNFPLGEYVYQSSTYVTVAPDSYLVASAQLADVRVWSVTSNDRLPETKAREMGHEMLALLPNATISPDSNLVSILFHAGTRLGVACTHDDEFTRTTLSRADKRECQTFPCPISPNSVYVADTLHESVIYVRLVDSASTDSVVCSLHGSPPVAFSADSSRIAFHAAQKNICIADIHNGKALLSLRLEEENVDAVAWSSDSKMVAIACFSTILIFSAETGVCMRRFDTGLATPKSEPIVSLAISHDSLLVAAITNEPVCGIYSVETGKCLREQKLKRQRRHLKKLRETVKFWSDGRLLTRYQAFKYQTARMSLEEAVFPQLGLTIDRDWVTWDGHNLLWVPMDYRNRIGPTSEEVMLLLSQANDLTFIRFDPDELRPHLGT